MTVVVWVAVLGCIAAAIAGAPQVALAAVSIAAVALGHRQDAAERCGEPKEMR